ncbi:aminotransferase-like domain-containing protein [Pedobacter gandavensis]|uniref:Aminotransferase class I/II-fold pyridoxal phosphate-dependent enzyme n=1 Tax=Pedobacter gandavensis TaxID=2679963 RepID=A0ABR6F273_9SPHI|nr:PLP-dependent aminotransferase family protein [Pedobacter gandavensis]MBB2151611.1 aminotransferase class I/II-fold pyridoxal phosphate-dependent enzyme [Pedobacter gandavensis]
MIKYRYEEISQEIALNITEGRLKPGHKLPSVRQLKQQYRAGLSTIQKAYELLIIMGLVESIPKSGYYVTLGKGDNNEIGFAKPSQARLRDELFKNNLEAITSNTDPLLRHRLNEFNVATPDDTFIPQKMILRNMQQVIREQGTKILRYYPSNGSEPLKDHITKRAALNHANFDAEGLIITDGALQAFYIAMAAVTSPGDAVAIESPCVFSMLQVLRTLRLKVVEIPVLDPDGFDLDFLEESLKTIPIKAIALTPNFHNPTGSLMSDENKWRLLQIAKAKDIPILENDVYGDLNFTDHRPGNISSMDDTGLVMTFSSYSKTLASGIRLGWLFTGRFFKVAEQIKFALGSTVSPVYQETMLKILATTSYERHIRTFRMKLASQCYQTMELISTHFPEKMLVSTPKGGYSIWLKMDKGMDMVKFHERCEDIGVRFTPGHTFSFSNAFDQYFRVVFAIKYTEQSLDVLKQAGQFAGKR